MCMILGPTSGLGYGVALCVIIPLDGIIPAEAICRTSGSRTTNRFTSLVTRSSGGRVHSPPLHMYPSAAFSFFEQNAGIGILTTVSEDIV